MGMPPKLFEYLKNTPSARMTEFYYDPESPPGEQMIVQLGFRMHPAEPNAPKMFRPDGTPRFSSAVTLMERGVEAGNADAAYRLGTIYQDGSGHVLPDVNRAIKWFQKAGELGTYAAYHNLGVMFGHGHGVNVDHKKAAEYYRKAAEVGFAGSQNNLGWSYYKGEGVAKNYGLAIYWITRSAEQGEPFAYSSLGEMRLYISFNGHGPTYPISTVGSSFICKIPLNKQGNLKPFRGQTIRVVCTGSGSHTDRQYMAGPYSSQK